MSAAAVAGKNNNNKNNGRDELSRYIKEGYDSFESGYDFNLELDKSRYIETYKNKNIFERLEDLGLKRVSNPGDGDCLYYSIEMYFKLTGTKVYNSDGKEIIINNLTLREMVANEILSEGFNPLHIGKNSEWIKENEELIKTPGSWDSEINEFSPDLLSKILQYNIIIYTIQKYERKENEYELNEAGEIKFKNGIAQKKRIEGKVVKKIVEKIPKYLAEGRRSVDKPKGNIYIVNYGRHYEALIPKYLLDINAVEKKIELIELLQHKASYELSLKISEKELEEAEIKQVVADEDLIEAEKAKDKKAIIKAKKNRKNADKMEEQANNEIEEKSKHVAFFSKKVEEAQQNYNTAIKSLSFEEFKMNINTRVHKFFELKESKNKEILGEILKAKKAKANAEVEEKTKAEAKKAELEAKAKARANAKTRKVTRNVSSSNSNSNTLRKLENKRRSTRLAAKALKGPNALKKAAAAGPPSSSEASSSESNNNSKPAGGAGKKSKNNKLKGLTRKQKANIEKIKKQFGYNTNTALSLIE